MLDRNFEVLFSFGILTSANETTYKNTYDMRLRCEKLHKNHPDYLKTAAKFQLLEGADCSSTFY